RMEIARRRERRRAENADHRFGLLRQSSGVGPAEEGPRRRGEDVDLGRVDRRGGQAGLGDFVRLCWQQGSAHGGIAAQWRCLPRYAAGANPAARTQSYMSDYQPRLFDYAVDGDAAGEFIVSESNEDAVALVRRWRAWPGGAMALYGPHGSGKT